MDSGGPKDCVLDGVQIPTGRGGTLEGDDVGIFPQATEHRSQWPDVGIFWHAVDQRSGSPFTEAVQCHIKFSQMANPPPAMQPVVKI